MERMNQKTADWLAKAAGDAQSPLATLLSGSIPTPRIAAKPGAAPSSTPHAVRPSAQAAQFRSLMIDLGLTQAEAIYAEVQRELEAIKDRG